MGKERTSGFFKTSPESPGEGGKAQSKYQRVAKFLVLIGSSRAAEILSRLPPDQIETISKEIAAAKVIGPEERQAILEEFSSLLASPYQAMGSSSGGVEAARRVLYAAFGEEKGERLLVKAVPDAKTNPFGFLEDFSGIELALLFRDESPAAAAMVFSRLPAKLSAQALSQTADDKKLDILKRIARQTAVSPEVLDRTAAALKEKAKRLSSPAGGEAAFDGMNALAAILKSSGAGFGDEILGQLEQEDPELGKTLKEKVYTIADLLTAPDLPIQKKLASMNDRDIILLLKARAGKEDAAAFRDKILSNLSQGRREELLVEESIVGGVPRRDVDEAAGAFLAWFRQGRETGTIILSEYDDLVM